MYSADKLQYSAGKVKLRKAGGFAGSILDVNSFLHANAGMGTYILIKDGIVCSLL